MLEWVAISSSRGPFHLYIKEASLIFRRGYPRLTCYRRLSLESLNSMPILYLWLADCLFLAAKFRPKLKEVGKTTRQFRYELNQIPYDYTVEVRNILKRLNLIDRVNDELWMEVHDIVQETGIKAIPKKKNFKKSKWMSEEALQIAMKRREMNSKGEKERYTYLNAEFQRIVKRDKKAFLSD